MRTTLGLLVAVSCAAFVPLACGSGSEGSTFGGTGIDDQTSSGGTSGTIGGSSGGTSGGTSGSTAQDVDVASMRIEPADATITVLGGQTATKPYKVFAKLKGTPNEIDITSRAVFYVPDNYLVGGFPVDGSATFSTRLPAAATDPPQRGGKLTVTATASNSDGPVTAKTSLTVKLSAILQSPAVTPALPASPETLFIGAPVATRNPSLAYPNDKAMLPPNLRRLEVHWTPTGGTDLYQVSFISAVAEITYYSRCGGATTKPAEFKAGSCAFELDDIGYAYVAESNRGAGAVKLRVRGSADAGGGFGESAEFNVEFAENRVDGGLYYWTVSNPPRIMRVDFGNPNSVLESFLEPNKNGMGTTCVGCHSISRDGTKLVGSLGGQNDGRLVYLNDLSKKNTDPTWLTQQGTTAASSANRIQFASFNPKGDQFVAVYGDSPDAATLHTLNFHDGTTGLRTSSKALTYKADHPDWSPDGKLIAVTHVGNEGTTTQRPTRGNIDLLTFAGATLGDPQVLVPQVTNKNRYNPNFVPDSSFLLFSESTCTSGNWDGAECDADADPSAKTWAVKPATGATPVLLARASAGGVADGAATNLGDTFPRSTPFQTVHRGGKLFWYTAASSRQVGLRTVGGAQHLWMFAIDPSKVVAGTDGSYPGFYLPFQDLTTSNHIGQWTEKIVGSSAPPPPPPPAPR